MNVESARPGAPNNWPSLAAVVNRIKSGAGHMPASIVVPEHIWNTGNVPWPGQDAGWLGRTVDPWLIHCEPADANFQVPALALPGEVTPLRFRARHGLLQQVNHHLDALDRSATAQTFDDKFAQAVDLLRAGSVRQAFDLQREPAQVRDRYGRHRWGQSVLLARRLVEAGIPLVQVNWTRIANKANDGAWDTHAQNAKCLKEFLMPMLDESCSALLTDLVERGMLEDTLVICMSEFGRTPRHNGAAGRDHWGPVFSIAMAGGGVRGGVVHGSSDGMGAYPRDGIVKPEDYAATVFHLLGIDPHHEVRDPLGRPVAISRGQVVRQIL
jgi:uncharacterized protein (DUF1501 family)